MSKPAAIDVALTPTDVRRCDVAVVIDVLRATSTATQALASGYRSVLCAPGIEQALALRAPGRVLAGERGCRVPPGFTMDNSPLEVSRVYADELVLATTNGTPTILAAACHARTVVLGCLLNLGAVIDELAGVDDVQLVCSGTDGRVTLEDVYVAGRVCERLEGPRTDAARIAEAVARAHPTALDALTAAGHARTLEAASLADDIEFCAREDVVDVVPRVTHATAGIAILECERAGTLIA